MSSTDAKTVIIEEVGGPEKLKLVDWPVGEIAQGKLADILIVDGDPTSDIRIMQDKEKIAAVMKDGKFHRAPPCSYFQ